MADRAVDKIRERFGWEAVGYGSVALGSALGAGRVQGAGGEGALRGGSLIALGVNLAAPRQ